MQDASTATRVEKEEKKQQTNQMKLRSILKNEGDKWHS